jgi:peptidoglycan/LPS O-acetylase OafA/YrhL
MDKIASLQTLRGVSILAVFLLHTIIATAVLDMLNLGTSFNTGWLGVEFFFVISGFVVTMSLHRNGFHVGSFYLKRLFRLMPCMLLMVAFAIAVSIWLKKSFPQWPYNFQKASEPWSQGFLAVSGLFTFVSWRQRPAIYSIGHSWSLSVEEQFYAAIGVGCLLLLVVARKRPRIMLGALGCGAAFWVIAITTARISIAASPEAIKRVPMFFRYLVEFKFDFLCSGVFLYWAYFTFDLRFRQRSILSIALIACAIGPFIWFGFFGHPFDVANARAMNAIARAGFPLAILSFMLAVLLAASDISLLPRDSIAYRLLIYLGERSYLMYLFHMPLVAVSWMICITHFPKAFLGIAAYGLMLFIVTSLLTLPLVELLHRYVENPLIALGARLSKRWRREAGPLPEPDTTMPSTQGREVYRTAA